MRAAWSGGENPHAAWNGGENPQVSPTRPSRFAFVQGDSRCHLVCGPSHVRSNVRNPTSGAPSAQRHSTSSRKHMGSYRSLASWSIDHDRSRRWRERLFRSRRMIRSWCVSVGVIVHGASAMRGGRSVWPGRRDAPATSHARRRTGLQVPSCGRSRRRPDRASTGLPADTTSRPS